MSLYGIGTILLVLAAAPAIAADYHPPPASQFLLSGADLLAAQPVDEEYRAQFQQCDDKNEFRGHQLTGWRQCSGDKNNVRALLRLSNGAILWESKLGLDLDGSWKAWNDKGAADQRGTWYQWPRVCPDSERDDQKLCQREQVDAEHTPFAVVPIAGPDEAGREFREKTGIGKGDLGVIIYRDKWVPVLVADGGPYNKLGEASAAALAALGESRCSHHNADGLCDGYKDTSIESGAITIIFPGSHPTGLTADNVVAKMCENAKSKLGLTGSPLCGS
jgi:Fungal chitosanase of glycosyl hydrolase group 75